MFEDGTDRRYLVVRNGEEQYSVWPEDEPVPAGWEPTGTAGVKAQCLEYIRQVWTDLRPKSLRERTARPS